MYVLGLIAPYLLFTILTILTICMICECRIFQYIASYEDAIEYRIRKLPVDVINLIAYIIRKIGMALALIGYIVCTPLRLLPVVVRFAYEYVLDCGKELVDYYYEVILFEC